MKLENWAETPAEVKATEASAKKKPNYPSLYLNDNQSKGVKGLSVGDKVMVHGEGLVTNYSEDKWGCRATIEVHAGLVMPKSNPKNTDDAYYEARKEMEEE